MIKSVDPETSKEQATGTFFQHQEIT